MTSKIILESSLTFIYDGSVSDSKVYKTTKRLTNDSSIRTMSLEGIDKTTLELGVKNPHEPEAEELQSPEETLENIKNVDIEVIDALKEIKI